ncbi:acyl-CoA dehydrogenase family protein [Catenulispora rubra]|uniref:acyl-CoA dehydrogenase family protein n=1 Tax=Catenulispora rubra TaxID=280293 RepID=UPI0018926ADF|nr:acyl-CoA dehydrogenase family protein [Catenulispora rubra]
MDSAERDLLNESLRKAMTASSGRALDVALAELGWADLLTEVPEFAIATTFRLFGETAAHAPLLNDVVLHAAGRTLGGTVPLPFAGGSWVVWERDDVDSSALDPDLPLRTTEAPSGDPIPLAAGRRALGWWLLGSGQAMLDLARSHALDREQFGRPIASFQAVRHRLAETLVALEGAQAALAAADDDLSSLLAKAAAGNAALTAARHCQQVLGGIGFTAEHGLHRHVRRVLVLDGLLGSARELTREAGALLLSNGRTPRLIQL